MWSDPGFCFFYCCWECWAYYPLSSLIYWKNNYYAPDSNDAQNQYIEIGLFISKSYYISYRKIMELPSAAALGKSK